MNAQVDMLPFIRRCGRKGNLDVDCGLRAQGSNT